MIQKLEIIEGPVKNDDMTWYVIAKSSSRDTFYQFNIFEHGGVATEVQKLIKRKPSRDVLEEELRHILMYYFWSKTEWEFLVTSMFQTAYHHAELKVDVYDQVNLNWERFVDYVCQFVPKKKNKTEEIDSRMGEKNDI